jgi:uncharacterized protein YjbJ (UPF0337 family)
VNRNRVANADPTTPNIGLRNWWLESRGRIRPRTEAVPLPESSQEVSAVGDRTQRVKGKANEVAGKAKAEAGYSTGSGKTEAKGVGKALKGKAQQATGRPAAR